MELRSDAKATNPTLRQTVLRVTVRNQPGVMSHVCGLFARRAFNVEGILCLPLGDGKESRIWLRVNEDARLEQVVRQVRKLADVLDVRLQGAEHDVFRQVETLVCGEELCDGGCA